MHRPSHIAAHRLQAEREVGSELGPSRLRQVVWNLLSNATKFTTPGGHVTVRLGRVDSQTEIVVSDTALGFAEISSHTFSIAFAKPMPGLLGGTRALGLDLAIVHDLVEMGGGTVEATSEGDGKGASFHVRSR